MVGGVKAMESGGGAVGGVVKCKLHDVAISHSEWRKARSVGPSVAVRADDAQSRSETVFSVASSHRRGEEKPRKKYADTAFSPILGGSRGLRPGVHSCPYAELGTNEQVVRARVAIARELVDRNLTLEELENVLETDFDFFTDYDD